MKLAIDIVQSLLLPKLEKDASFYANQTNIAFWETITNAFLDFEKDAKPVYDAIYNLGLKDAEKIIYKLDTVYISFIKELAENHVLGISSEAIDYLISSKNSAFEKDVHFFTDLQNAITKVERKRIKTELPKAYDKLNFEISDDAIALAIKKKERENLKEKMNDWDEQLVTSEEAPVYYISAKKEPKVISLSWIKYVAAACVVLSAGIFFFKQSTNSNLNFIQSNDNNVVVSPVKRKAVESSSMKNIVEDIQSIRIEQITTNAVNLNVLKNDYGFAPDKQKIKIVVNDQNNRIQSLNKAIKQYERLLKDRKYKPQYNKLKVLISEHETELERCKSLESKYVFNGKELTLYSKLKGVQLLEYDGDFYLKRDTNYYKLILSKQPKEFEKVTDSNVLEALEKIIFNNE
jgi:hypothetical protein